MCNQYGNRVSYSAYVEEFSQIRLPLRFAGAAPNLEPRDEIRPTDPAPVIRATEDGAEFLELRWGLPPGRPKAPPVINMRSEGRSFDRGRSLVPASFFYEFTGAKYPKTRWRFTMVGEDWFCFAGLWRPGKDGEDDRFTLLTTEPGPDVQPIHDRQPVVLERKHWAGWLNGSSPTGDVLRPSPAGTLRVEEAPRG